MVGARGNGEEMSRGGRETLNLFIHTETKPALLTIFQKDCTKGNLGNYAAEPEKIGMVNYCMICCVEGKKCCSLNGEAKCSKHLMWKQP